MTTPAEVTFSETDLNAISDTKGHLVVLVKSDGSLDPAGRRVNRHMKGALARYLESDGFAKVKEGAVTSFAYPTGLAADAVHVLCIERRNNALTAKRAGATTAKAAGGKALTILAGNHPNAAALAMGAALRGYDFSDHKTAETTKAAGISVMCTKPEDAKTAYAPMAAVAEGVFITRDLTNDPANVLTTTEFAKRAFDMSALGLKVTVLEEEDLEKLGMGSMLSVGQGAEAPSKVAIMEWNGGAKGDAPLALVGKGVVFDTGGISLKPAAGMEDMTMDMGGAGVVTGVMRALALRQAKANVVGLIGLVENMPSGNATRPGDVVKSMKGDTIEVINTDAEGRLVLCDVMWYAQEKFKPAAMIDLATLTGAVIIGLGHENAGVFSNDDKLCNAFLKAAETEGEGAWRLPLGKAYASQLKSRIADMKNTGGRPAGSITAAEFLHNFVQDGMPWIHLDIAGVASVKSDTAYAPKGATGWGVMALDRLVQDMFEH